MKIEMFFVSLLLGATLTSTVGVEGLKAQKNDKKYTSTRTLSGHVLDAEGNGVPYATIRLKNLMTNKIRAASAKENGQYRFTNLKTTVDYEVQAEHNGTVSRPRKITTFDKRKKVIYVLKLSSSQ